MVHLIAFTAEEAVAPFAHSYFVVGLELVTPVAVVAEEGVTFIARYLYPYLRRGRRTAVQTMQFASSAVFVVVVFVVAAAVATG